MMLSRFSLFLSTLLAVPLMTSCSQSEREDFNGKMAVLSMPVFPGGKANPYTGYSTPSITLYGAIFDGFTNLKADGTFEPALATHWRQLDPLTWEFHLREELTFSNGEPFNANAVVRAANYLKTDEAQRYGILRELGVLDTVVALDDHNLRITTKTPVPLLPRVLSAFRIVAPEYWDRVGADVFATAPIGTGPFAVERWEEARIVLRRNKTSWRPALLDRLDILAISDSSVRMQTLTSGEVDIAMTISPEQKASLVSSGYRFQNQKAPNNVVFTFITKEGGPIADPRVRQALNMAIDRKPIIDVFLDGQADVPSQPAVKGAFGYNPDLKPFAYAPERARALLAEAGYSDGFEMTIEVIVGGSTNDSVIFQQIFSDLEKIGVRVNPQIITIAQMVTGIGSGQWKGQSFILDYSMLPALDASAVMPIHSCLRRLAWHCDESVMPLVEDIYAESNLEKRESLTRDLMVALNKNPPALILYEAVSFNGLAPRVKDFRAGYGMIDYEDMDVVENR